MMEPKSETEVKMPNLVFELVSKHLCPKILRPCRLVCKSWNDIACGILQRFPVCFAEKGGSQDPHQKCNQRLSVFSDLLAARKEKISHPFRKISIEKIGRCSGKEKFWVLILQLRQYKDIEVSNLEFEYWTSGGPLELESEIMAWSQGTLRSLSLHIDRPFFTNPFEYNLQNLENLEILTYLRNEGEGPGEGSIKTLLENILHGPKLNKLSLTIVIANFQMHKEIMSIEKIRRVSSLQIRYLHIVNSDIVGYFKQNSFPNVKSLSIIGESQSQFCFQLIEIFAQSLEILTYSHSRSVFRRDPPLALNLFPTCPQLRELNVTRTFMCVIDSSFSEKFPSLKRFSCHDRLKALGEVRPHFGVECLNVSVTALPAYNSENCTCCKIVKDLLQNFPHFNGSFDHHLRDQVCSTVESLWTMVKYFPNVRALKIKYCGELIRYISAIVSSIPSEDDVSQVRTEKVFQDLFPLQNFPKMKSLDLSQSNMTLMPALIRQCVGKITTLRNLRLSAYGWTGSESDHETLEALRECLQPVNELQYVHCLSGFSHIYQEILIPTLFPLVANIVCLGNSYCNCEDLDICKRTCQCEYCKKDFPFLD